MNKNFYILILMIPIFTNQFVKADGNGSIMSADDHHSQPILDTTPKQEVSMDDDCYKASDVDITNDGAKKTYTVKNNSSPILGRLLTPNWGESPAKEVPKTAICFSKGQKTKTIMPYSPSKATTSPSVTASHSTSFKVLSQSNASLLTNLDLLAQKSKSPVEFQNNFCREGNSITKIYSVRSNVGAICSVESMAGLALNVCQNKQDFNQSNCMQKVKSVLGTTDGKKEITNALMSNNPVKKFICNNLFKFPASIIDLAQSKCKS